VEAGEVPTHPLAEGAQALRRFVDGELNVRRQVNASIDYDITTRHNPVSGGTTMSTGISLGLVMGVLFGVVFGITMGTTMGILLGVVFGVVFCVGYSFKKTKKD
jgi:tetrahydromethanopterin S-methyltransferase subunit G